MIVDETLTIHAHYAFTTSNDKNLNRPISVIKIHTANNTIVASGGTRRTGRRVQGWETECTPYATT